MAGDRFGEVVDDDGAPLPAYAVPATQLKPGTGAPGLGFRRRADAGAEDARLELTDARPGLDRSPPPRQRDGHRLAHDAELIGCWASRTPYARAVYGVKASGNDTWVEVAGVWRAEAEQVVGAGLP